MDTPEGPVLHLTNWPGKPGVPVTRVRRAAGPVCGLGGA
jgi:hypothetical protein